MGAGLENLPQQGSAVRRSWTGAGAQKALSALALVWFGIGLQAFAHSPAAASSAEEVLALSLELLAPAREAAGAARWADALAAAEEARAAIARFPSPYAELVTARLLDDMAQWRFEAGDHAGAVVAADEAYRLAAAVFGVESANLESYARTLARLDMAVGACGSAIARLQPMLAPVAALGPDGGPYAAAVIELARIYRAVGNGQAAREVLTMLERLGSVPARYRQEILALHFQLALDRFALEEARTFLERVAVLTRDDPGAHRWRRLLEARLARGQADFQASLRLLEPLVASELDHRPDGLGASLLAEYGVLLGYRGRFVEAEFYLQHALDAQAAHPVLSHSKGWLHASLGWAYRWLGELDLAMHHYEIALRIREACTGAQDRETVLLLLQRARLLLDTQGTDAASLRRVQSDLNRARGIVDALVEPGPLDAAYVNHELARLRVRQGRLGAAREAALETVRTIEAVRGAETEDLVQNFTLLADIALRDAKPEEAVQWAKRAVAFREASGADSLWGLGTALSLLAAAQSASGVRDGFEATFDRLATLGARYLSESAAAGAMIGEEIRQQRDALDRVLDALTLQGDLNRVPVGAATLFQLPHLSDAAVAASALAVSARMSGGEAGGKALDWSERARLSEQLRAEQTQIRLLLEQGAGTDEETLQSLFRKAEQTRTAIRTVTARLLDGAPERAVLMLPEAVDLEAVVPLMKAEEALLIQAVTERATHTLLVRSDGTTAYRQASIGRETVRRHVGRLRRALDLGLPVSERLSFDDAAARELYLAAVAPIEGLLDGVTELLIVPDDAFQRIPWGVFRSPSSDASPGSSLIERYSLTTLPSPGVLVALRGVQEIPRATEPFVGFGDPGLRGRAGGPARPPASLITDFIRGPGPDDVAELEPLPHTRNELRALAQLFGAPAEAVKLGAQATRRTVLSTPLERYRVISFATHGLLSGDVRGLAEPALVLTPDTSNSTGADNGLLLASEIAGLRFNADLVILSACNTGLAGEQTGSSGLSALARSFLSAGSRALMVSHWSVSSEATTLLMERAVVEMTGEQPKNPAQALRTAMLWMKNGGAGSRYTDPAYWGPFVIVGEGGVAFGKKEASHVSEA